MNERDHDEISRFLTMVGKSSLFDYLQVAADASAGAVEQAIKKRRSWAQGQQANPKYRSEALWVIKNQRLLRAALIDHRDQYLSRMSSKDEERSLEVLSLFVRGTLASGELTDSGRRAILEQGRSLGLSEAATVGLLDKLVEEAGLGAAPEAPAFVDHYEALEIPPTASSEQIEQAYRKKYRWARTLSDTRKAQRVYASLDAALRDLRDPLKRSEYDAAYRRAKGLGAAPADAAAYLPPPTPDDPPSQGSYHSGTFPSVEGPPPRRDRHESTEPPGTAPPVKTPGRTSGAFPAAPPPRAATPDVQQSPPPARGAPRPPEQLAGRTLSLEGRQDSARLELASGREVQLTVGRRPEMVEIQLRRVGDGEVTARVLADRDWVSVSPARISADVSEPLINATVHPERMSRDRSTSVVTIVPSHGPRLSVTLDVERTRSGPPILPIVAGLAVVGAVAAAGSWYLGQDPGPPPGRIQVQADPPTAVVYADDSLLGAGTIEVPTELASAGPVELRVELDGFSTWTRTVEAPAGETVLVQPRLELREPLSFKPAPNFDATEIEAASVAATLGEHPQLFADCVPAGQSVEARVYVAFGGDVKGLEFEEPPDQEVVGCLARGLSALTFKTPAVPTDYFWFSHTFGAPAP